MAGDMNTGFRRLLGACAIGSLALMMTVHGIDARPGGGASSGSRGSSTGSPPPATATAPRTAQPMQRTETPGVNAPRPGAPAAAPSRGLGFGGGLMAGLFGAGILGLMFGGGLFGGLGGLTSIIGLLIQVGLIVGLIWLAMRLFRRRQEPALAGAGAPGPVPHAERSALGGMGGGGRAPARQPLEIVAADFQAFERALCDVQVSYGRGDLGALRRLATPEMVRYFEQDLAQDRSRGVRNEVSEPKLLQGDLSEAWREGPTEYATVAMRFSIVEAYVELASGRVASGNRSAPTEATELWTFRRDPGTGWVLSAIQQTA